MYKSLTITVIIPCLNEEQGIEKVLRAMPDFVDEVIVVDNNSTDRTSEVAASLGAKVVREQVRGYGRSYKRGFAEATSDLIITLDGDHSYPVDAISYLIEAFLHLEVDFLNASRFPVRDRGGMSFNQRDRQSRPVAGHVLALLPLGARFAIRHVGLPPLHPQGHEAGIRRHGLLRGDQDRGLRDSRIRFGEISIMYTSRVGEIKLNPWRDGIQNLLLLFKKRFFR